MHYDTPSQRVGANVRAELARRRVSQAGLASYLGLSQSGVSSRLSGKTPFDVDELQRTADFLGLPAAALLASDVASVAS